MQGDLIRRLGEEHEQHYLGKLRADGREVVEIDVVRDWDWERAARETEEALRAGADVVYQACFVDGEWRGLADFVERQPDGSYEAVDTKLARHGKPEHILQLCFYSEQIERITGRQPEKLHIELGSGERESYRVGDFLAYYRRVRDASSPPSATAPRPSRTRAASATAATSRSVCNAWWDERDHLVRVAGMRRDAIARLAGVGITTLEELGDAPADTAVPRMAAATFAKLRAAGRAPAPVPPDRGAQPTSCSPLEAERGFGLLPKPSPGDLFFDIEGDPFWDTDRGLEYLFGVTDVRDGEPHFTALWAHDRDEEKRDARGLHRPRPRAPARAIPTSTSTTTRRTRRPR